jgi:hypothetical protein
LQGLIACRASVSLRKPSSGRRQDGQNSSTPVRPASPPPTQRSPGQAVITCSTEKPRRLRTRQSCVRCCDLEAARLAVQSEMKDASSRHFAVDDVTAAAPPSQDAEFGPACPEANVSAKATNQTMMMVARAIVRGRSLRWSITIPSKEHAASMRKRRACRLLLVSGRRRNAGCHDPRRYRNGTVSTYNAIRAKKYGCT